MLGRLRLALSALVGLLAACSVEAAQFAFDSECGTKSWFGSCSGNRTNWDPNGLPGIDDVVMIDEGQGPVIAGSGGGTTVISLRSLKAPGGLRIGSVNLRLQDPSEIHGFEWFDTMITSSVVGFTPAFTLRNRQTSPSACGTNGWIVGQGGPAAGAATILRNEGTLNVDGLCVVNGARWENAMGGQVAQRSQLRLHPNASAVNDGTWIFTNNNADVDKFDVSADPDTARFVNNSMLRNADGGSTIDVVFESSADASIDIQKGRLTFHRIGSLRGSVAIGAGARLVSLPALGRQNTFAGNVPVAGAGVLELMGSHLVAMDGRVESVLGEGLPDSGSFLFLHGVDLEIGAGGALANKGRIVWGTSGQSAGTVRGAGSIENAAGALLEIGAADAALAASFQNDGTVDQKAQLTVGQAGRSIVNGNRGTWELRRVAIRRAEPFVPMAILNRGTFFAPSNMPGSVVDVPFDMAGDGALIAAPGATVELRSGGRWSSRSPLGAGGAIVLGSLSAEHQIYNVVGESSFNDPLFGDNGVIRVAERATLRIEGELTLVGERFRTWLDGGSVTGPGTLINEGRLFAERGRLGDLIDGRLLLRNHNRLEIAGDIDFHGTLENTAPMNALGVFLHGQARLTLTPGSLIDNLAGPIWLDGDSGLDGDGSLRNRGVLRKTGGGHTIVEVPVDNRGEVRAENGALNLAAGVAQVQGNTLAGGQWNVARGSSLIVGNALIRTIGPAAQVTVGGTQLVGSAFSNLVRVAGTLTIFDALRMESAAVDPSGRVATTRESGQRATDRQRRPAGAGVDTGPAPVPPEIRFVLDGAAFVNDGTAIPGESGGTAPFGIDGSYTQSASGRLHLDVGAEEHDQLYVTGAATLGGALEVDFLDGYRPSSEDVIVVVLAGSIAGRFANAEDRLVTGEGTFDVTYTETSVQLSGFVPGPKFTPTPVTTGGIPTATPTTPRACTGDCNGDLRVSVAELTRGVAIALGRQPLGVCPELDPQSDGLVSIDDLVAAVRAALGPCAR